MTESTLRVLRRRKYGRGKDAAKTLSLSRWTLFRAECGGCVGDATKRKLSRVFRLPWRTLQREWRFK